MRGGCGPGYNSSRRRRPARARRTRGQDARGSGAQSHKGGAELQCAPRQGRGRNERGNTMATSNVTRRSLVKGAALGAASLGVAAGAGAALADEAAGYKDPSSWVKATQNVEWDEEHDIVVVGYGMAGTTAYVEAVEIDPDVDIVIYDSSDEENAGGQAVASGQCVIFPEPNDIETFRTYMHAMNEPNPVPEEDFEWLTTCLLYTSPSPRD